MLGFYFKLETVLPQGTTAETIIITTITITVGEEFLRIWTYSYMFQ